MENAWKYTFGNCNYLQKDRILFESEEYITSSSDEIAEIAINIINSIFVNGLPQQGKPFEEFFRPIIEEILAIESLQEEEEVSTKNIQMLKILFFRLVCLQRYIWWLSQNNAFHSLFCKIFKKHNPSFNQEQTLFKIQNKLQNKCCYFAKKLDITFIENNVVEMGEKLQSTECFVKK